MSESKRSDQLQVERVQRGNQEWWTRETMSYDWRARHTAERFSREWFDSADAAFVKGARLFATDRQPFDRIIPLDRLAGRRVLEIGCGMGLHAEILVRAGARLTAVDLSPTSVEATQRRFALKGLTGEILQADAERLPFDDHSFDFVWSWGVIHHSSRTARIVRQMASLLTPDGECRVMVYNRASTAAAAALFRDQVLHGGFLKRSFEESLFQESDGFSARFYTRDQFEDLFRAFFREVSAEICGQDADALPLPGTLRRIALRLVPESYLRRAQARRGGFIFLKARYPE